MCIRITTPNELPLPKGAGKLPWDGIDRGIAWNNCCLARHGPRWTNQPTQLPVVDPMWWFRKKYRVHSTWRIISYKSSSFHNLIVVHSRQMHEYSTVIRKKHVGIWLLCGSRTRTSSVAHFLCKTVRDILGSFGWRIGGCSARAYRLLIVGAKRAAPDLITTVITHAQPTYPLLLSCLLPLYDDDHHNEHF